MTKINKYKKVESLEIEVNNNRKLKCEFIETDEAKYYNKRLKITTLDSQGDIEKAIYISEGDLVLLYNLYIFKKENNEEIF